MIEALGLIFGGASRLLQHHMDLKDKQAERDHEHRMFEQQVELGKQNQSHEKAMLETQVSADDLMAQYSLMSDAIKAQAEEASKAGGWVAKFSAAMRPFLTFWHAVVLYTAIKVAMFYLAFNNGLSWADALLHIYGESDKAMCMSMVGFWFADRSLRKGK